MDWDNRKLRLAGIAGDSIVDGPGIRMTLFAQGCPHHCQGCHNPETWEFDGGTWWTTDDLVKVIEENPLAKGIKEPGIRSGELFGIYYGRTFAGIPRAADAFRETGCTD